MRSRIYGTEVEHATGIELPDGSWDPIQSTDYYSNFADTLDGIGFVKADIKSSGVWGPNAGLLYVDRSNVPEYATPECRSIRDVVKQTKAGEIIVDKALAKVHGNKKGKLWIYKNNLDFQKNTRKNTLVNRTVGFHENYMVNYDFTSTEPLHEMRSHLIPFLITRQLLDGAGWYDDKGRFAFSQRSLVMETEYGINTTKLRPILGTKTKPQQYVDKGKNGDDATVLQLILGDTNILETALFLKMGTTSIVLSMLEDGWLVFDDLCINPVSTMKNVAYDDSMSERLISIHGQPVSFSSLDVQKIYAEKAEQYLINTDPASEEDEAEAWDVLHLWQEVLSILESGRQESLVGSLDHVTKRHYSEGLVTRKNKKTKKEKLNTVRSFELEYHCVNKRNTQNIIRERRPGMLAISSKEIEEAAKLSPQNTRARQRAKCIEFIKTEAVYCSVYIQWVKLMVDDKACILRNPYDCSLDKVEEFINTVRQLSDERLKTNT